MFENLKNKKGAISTVHAIVVSAIMLSLLFFGILLFNNKVKNNAEDIDNKIVSGFEDEDFILSKPIELPPIDDDLDGSDNGDGSNSGGEITDVKQISVTLERNKTQNREAIITLPNLKEIINIKSSNGGLVEIISKNNDEVKIRVTNGKPNDYVVISGTYIPGGSKTVEMQESPNYSDAYGYKGTLTRYLISYRAPETIVIDDYLVESMTNSFPSTQFYTEKGFSTNLVKKGNSIATVIQGSPSDSKLIEAQEKPSYTEPITDNGISTAYTGTLTQYVYSGEASVSKSVTVTESSYTNSFDNTKIYNQDKYTGTLTKAGSVITTVDKGSASNSKTVAIQDNPTYSEAVNDNGIQTAYTGTLTQYVYQGSALKTKNVTDQTTSSYVETINDNGIETNYTGTLTQYVASGYAPDSKTYTVTETNYSNSTFADTKNITDGLYSGVINKSGSPVELIGGNAPISKNVTAQTSPNYNDGTYSGTLTQYVYSGSAPLSKYVNGQTSASYNDGTYSGTLTQYVSGGAAPQTKYLSGNLSGGVTYLKQTFGSGYVYPYNDGTFSGNLYWQSESHKHHPDGVSLTFTYEQFTTDINDASLYTLSWEVIKEKLTAQNPAVTNMKLVNVNWTGPVQSGSFVSDGVTYSSKRSATGTITADGWEVIAVVAGNVTSKDTRTYAYGGYVYTPDTRVYRYQGTVWTADTKYSYWTQTYSGTIYRPDSRVYRYQGTVTKPDTRVYKYQGTVTKPDTRVYLYTQNYTGTVKTEDTRIYKYKGTVTKPDTRVYKYTQYYKGVIEIPEEAIYRYKGVVTKPATDTRVIENYYKYDLTIDYKEN